MSASDVSGASVAAPVVVDVSGSAAPVVDVSGSAVASIASVVVDVSGSSALADVFASPAVAQLLVLLKDTLKNSPKTTADAIALFKKLSEQLAMIVVNELPPEMKEAALKQLWIAKEVEAVCMKSCFGLGK